MTPDGLRVTPDGLRVTPDWLRVTFARLCTTLQAAA